MSLIWFLVISWISEFCTLVSCQEIPKVLSLAWTILKCSCLVSRLTRNRPLWRKELQQDPNLSAKDTRECCIWFPFQNYTVSVQCSLAQMQWKIQMTFKILITSHQLLPAGIFEIALQPLLWAAGNKQSSPISFSWNISPFRKCIWCVLNNIFIL